MQTTRLDIRARVNYYIDSSSRTNDMPRVTDNLRNAQILADFSNLEPAQVEYFRNNYPDFAPHLWWDYQYKGGERAWESTQKSLRHAWGNQFKDGILNLLGLLNSVTAPLRLAD